MKIAACLHLSNEQGNSLVNDARVLEAMNIVDGYFLHLKSLSQLYRHLVNEKGRF